MVVISAGIRPRDELARACGLEVGPRGGVVVDDRLRTSDPDIFAIGEVALHRGMIYGLVAPGYEMADVVAANLAGGRAPFTGFDMSTKLKLMGVDVASFGDIFAEASGARPLTYEDPFRRGLQEAGVQRRTAPASSGGILVGDASDYGTLLAHFKSDKPLPVAPGELLANPGGNRAGAPAGWRGDAQVCSCNNVSEGADPRRRSERRSSPRSPRSSQCTKAGTGCGGCLPQVTDLLKAELQAAGKTVNNHLCEHFALQPPGTLPDRQDQGDQDVRRPDRRARARATAARSASRPWRRSWPASGTRTSSTRATPRSRTRTTGSSPTSSAAGCTRSSRGSPAARSRPRS